MKPPACTRVGARELKTRLGGYLRQVRQGTTIVVTERGEPVAQLCPLPPRGARDEDARLADLERLGVLTRRIPGPPQPFRPVRMRGASLSDAVVEEREHWP
jgi:prevent-host-death family protein